ncbi:hypothetical protein GY45DRAFT_581235 [Cubamyces sp. BRFM 1775]|nr:hypothetical protein GY45DRAFT_581235 [Cubamyces sp. BRFM 1775]
MRRFWTSTIERYRGRTRGPRLGVPCRAWRPAVRDSSSYAKHPIRCIAWMRWARPTHCFHSKGNMTNMPYTMVAIQTVGSIGRRGWPLAPGPCPLAGICQWRGLWQTAVTLGNKVDVCTYGVAVTG